MPNLSCTVPFSLAVAILSSLLALPASAQIQGYGKDATGGAGGSVCTVTTSAGSGTGSFSSCLSQGNRTIQFAVASTTVSSTQYVRSNTTIDGCANGQNGVTIDQTAASNRGIIIEGPVSNIVVRCMRFQGSGNNTEEFDLLSLDGTGGQISRIAVERSTFAGAPDGALDITGDVSDVTVQKSLFYGSVLTQLIKYYTRTRMSLHHNVYTAGAERNPQIKGDATKFDFVSNVVHANTAASYGYGTRLWNGNSSSDSPGNVEVNIVANAYMGTNGNIEIQTDSGASASDIYIASNNYCSPASNCPSSPASSPFTVAAGYEVTPTLPGCMATAMLPTVGAPNRTTTDTQKLNAVLAALPTNCSGGSTPTLSIGDKSLTEGNTGTTTATFTVTLSAAATGSVTVSFATANGTATAGTDYVAQTGTLTFTAGQTARTIAVIVNGDTAVESNETFTVSLSSPSGATLLDGLATGTIVTDDSLPQLSIGDVSLTEGNSGTKVATFTVTLSAASTSPVSATYATANGTATAGSDYTATGGTVSFPAGSLSQTLSVTLNGDTTVEPNETFTVTLSAPSGATLADGQATGTITNDDTAAVPTLSITDAAVTEGNSGTTTANFAVTLSAAASGTVTVGFSTANGTATAGSDFTAQSGTLTFTAGQTSKTITVPVIGDATVEANETFTVTLSAPTGATLADAQGIGTIVNDDAAPPTSGENVVWTSLVGVAANGPSLTKTATTGWGTGGAVSTKALTSGNGYVEFTATETNTYRLLGLSNGNTDQNWDDIDFGIYLYLTQVKIYEKGALRGTFTSDATGDRFRVSVESGVVKYLKNGTVFYTSSGTLTYPLLVDTSFYSQGATVTNAFISGAWAANPNPNPTPTPTPPPSSGESVVWTSVVGASANGGTLTKTAATAWGNAGAVSSKTLASGVNGYVEFTATETSTYRLLGLSNGDSNQSWDDIDFGMFLNVSQVQVYEKGVLKGTFGTYASGDKLQVALASGVVKYKKNGVVLYSSASVPVFPLLVDTSLYSQGATFTNAILSGAWATGTPPPPSSGTPVVWTSLVGASANGGTLTKTAATAWGNSGAISNKTLASGTGYVEFTATETSTYRMLGLSNGNSSQNWDDVDFSVYLFNTYIQVYEKGVLKGTFGTYSSGDKLQVAVESGIVKYKKNGVVFYTSTLAPVFPLLVDTSLYSQGATFTNTVVSGTWQ